MVYSEVLLERGLHMHIYVLDCYSCLATGGMLQELFTKIPLRVLTAEIGDQVEFGLFKKLGDETTRRIPGRV